MYRAKRGASLLLCSLVIRGSRARGSLYHHRIPRWSRKQVVPPVGNFHLIYSIRQTTFSLANTVGGRRSPSVALVFASLSHPRPPVAIDDCLGKNFQIYSPISCNFIASVAKKKCIRFLVVNFRIFDNFY